MWMAQDRSQSDDPNRDCQLTTQGDCIIAALGRLETAIADTAGSNEARQEAL